LPQWLLVEIVAVLRVADQQIAGAIATAVAACQKQMAAGAAFGSGIWAALVGPARARDLDTRAFANA